MATLDAVAGGDEVVLLEAARSQAPRRSPGRKETFADPHPPPLEQQHGRAGAANAAVVRIKSESLSRAPSPMSGTDELSGTGDAKSEADVVELLETLPNNNNNSNINLLSSPGSSKLPYAANPVATHVTPASPSSSSPSAAAAALVPALSALDVVDAGVSSKPGSKPASSAAAPASAPPPASQKPKSVRRPRSPSPEQPPPPPPQLRTIRLDIPLGGPNNYAVDITKLAKETGQRSPTPPPPLKRVSDSEGEDDDDDPKKGISAGKGKAGRKKNLASEYYDLNDPFIDDSELAVDERTYFAQTKQQGFYVSSGEVALLKDKTPKKTKAKRVVVPTIIPLAGSQSMNSASKPVSTSTSGDPFGPPLPSQPMTNGSISNGGTRDAPIALLSDTEDSKSSISGLKRKSSETGGNGKKKRKTVEIEMFHPELQAVLNELKDAISKESFEQKGKFPPSLKPILTKVALKAIHCGEYDDNFFSLMPKLFIYNKFTMTKLIKRTVYPEHQKLLLARQDELLDELGKVAEEGFPKAQEEYEKNLRHWEQRQEKAKADGNGTGVTSAEGTPAPGSTTPSVNGTTLPLPHERDSTNESAHGMDVDGPPLSQVGGEKDGATGKSAGEHPPSKRYRLTERMRNIIWELVVLSNESCRIENEKNGLESSTVQVSEQGTRKVLYQKIVSAFREGWMSSGQISREVSVMKKRFEAQQAEESA